MVPFINQWHFTVTQQHQLTELMRQWHALWKERPLSEIDVTGCRTAHQFLQKLKQEILSFTPVISLNG